MRISRSLLLPLAAFITAGFVTPAEAVIAVEGLVPLTGPPVANVWYNTSGAGGTASIPDLTGVGGALENNQPLGPAAARLTTGPSTSDRGRAQTFQDFGDAFTVLSTGSLSYDYFKVNVPGGNAFAAPSLQLSLFSPVATGDNDSFGTLVYEPTWNQGGGGSSLVPTGDWQAVSIDSSNGGWWWTGGFEQPNTAGGPPIRTLGEWADLFDDDPDFDQARVVTLGVNVGTFNTDVDSYVDDVSLVVPGGVDLTYDFSAVPEPALGGCFAAIAFVIAAKVGRRDSND